MQNATEMDGKKESYSFGGGEWHRGPSPLRSLRTGLEPLGSSGSHHPAVGFTPNCRCGNNSGCLLAILPNQYTAFVRWCLNLLNGFAVFKDSSHLLVDLQIKLDDSPPSLHLHYRDFIATTG